jgi:hypothetical protein
MTTSLVTRVILCPGEKKKHTHSQEKTHYEEPIGRCMHVAHYQNQTHVRRRAIGIVGVVTSVRCALKKRRGQSWP